MDNLVCSESSRLLANIIMTYNAIILNTFYENLCARYGEEKAKRIVSKISPIAWGHLSFTGKYLFKSSRNDVDIDGLVIQLKSKWLDDI